METGANAAFILHKILHERTLNAAKLAVPVSIAVFGGLLDMNCISNAQHADSGV